ncbi:MAG: 4-hydroxythreonine-4-phosphate dehydrogenase PdxA [Deferribacteraceae bacterium]|jgi:4-hydroxythreonine-4-phosphate dehydrogenase|nr:4-hydroxythreonine-4-phosphate dehydrogenase PdxA [Deferribacteraceae bacterium]
MKSIAVTIGDPAGIGAEIIAKTLLERDFVEQYPFTVVAPKFVLDDAFESILKTGRTDPAPTVEELPYDITPFPIKYGVCSAECGKIAMQAVEHAVKLTMAGRFDAIVTAPINKHAIAMAGYNYAGHTEYLEALTGGKDVAMMLASDKVRVILVTTHLPIKDIPEQITHEKVLSAIRSADRAGRLFGIDHPRIAVCGLNPHAGDNGTLGDEEITTIIPAIKQAVNEGINATGVHSADALYAHCDSFDISVAMYHDQGLIPVKMGGSDNVVNITLNLPIIRTSVGHGTAFDIAGKGIANNNSLKNAIIAAHRIANNV